MSITFNGVCEELGKWIQHQVEEDGFKTPLHLVTVGRNGAMMFFRYDDDGSGALEATDLASHIEAPGFEFPLHLMLTDCTGRCAHLGFERDSH